MRYEPNHFQVIDKGEDAEILLYGPIGEDYFGGVSAEAFSEAYYPHRNKKILDVRINSPGGDVFEGYAIYARIAQHPGRVNMYIDGMAASIASFIAMAGDSIEMAANSEFMIHDPTAGAIGRIEDFESLIERLKVHRDNIAKTYEARTKNDFSKLRDWMNAETTFSPEDSVKNGFAHSISPRKSLAAFAPMQPKFLRRLDDHSSTRLNEWKSVLVRGQLPELTAKSESPAASTESDPLPETEKKPTLDEIQAAIQERRLKNREEAA